MDAEPNALHNVLQSRPRAALSAHNLKPPYHVAKLDVLFKCALAVVGSLRKYLCAI